MFNKIKYPLGIGMLNFFQNNKLPQQKLQPVHVIGNGWASYHFVKSLDKSKYYPIIIAPNKMVLNTPKLIDSINKESTDLYFGHIESVYQICDVVKDIDLKTNTILTEKNSSIKFDYVVVAIGSEVNNFGIKGIDQYACKIKNPENIQELQKKLVLLDNIEKTNKDIVIMGAGPIGIELAFKLKNLGHHIQLIEGSNEILPGFSNETIQEVNTKLSESKINLIKSNPVISVEPNGIKTKSQFVPFDIAVWTGGVRFNGYQKTHLYRSLNSIGKVTPRGIEVQNDFSIEKYPNVFCIGDIVANRGPPTAQNASNQAKWLAQYFSNSFDKTKINPYKISELGKILHINGQLYLESKYYTGYLPNFLEPIIDFMHKR